MIVNAKFYFHHKKHLIPPQWVELGKRGWNTPGNLYESLGNAFFYCSFLRWNQRIEIFPRFHGKHLLLLGD